MGEGLKVGCNEETVLAPSLDPNFRCLKDILSPVQPGRPCAAPPLELIQQQQGEAKLMLKDEVVGHSSLYPYGQAEVETFAL
jgi:hypothetical protein